MGKASWLVPAPEHAQCGTYQRHRRRRLAQACQARSLSLACLVSLVRLTISFGLKGMRKDSIRQEVEIRFRDAISTLHEDSLMVLNDKFK